MHYQFEAIHPFTDGNGRTGRILNILFLVDQGLLEIPVLYLSRYIIQHKQEYYQGLNRITAKVIGKLGFYLCLMLFERRRSGRLRRCNRSVS
jgi:Fic family protein